TRESCGVDDILRVFYIGILTMERDMFRGRAVTTFAIHTQQYLLWIKRLYLTNSSAHLEERAVTFKAPRSDGTVEYNLVGRKSRTIGPYRIRCIIRSR